MNQIFSNIESDCARSSNSALDAQPADKAVYEAPRLITHGLLRDLTLQSCPDGQSFNPSTGGCETADT